MLSAVKQTASVVRAFSTRSSAGLALGLIVGVFLRYGFPRSIAAFALNRFCR